jgi:hypothetical protein
MRKRMRGFAVKHHRCGHSAPFDYQAKASCKQGAELVIYSEPQRAKSRRAGAA